MNRRRSSSEALLALQAMQARRRMAGSPVGVGVSRRGFLQQGASMGLALGLPPLLAACGGDDEGASPAPRTQTLFFNLAHEAGHAGKSYFLKAAGKTYRLSRVQDEPAVLGAARQTNGFLRALGDEHITHHAIGVAAPPDTVSIAYLGAEIDPGAGTWAMSGVFLQIPASGIAAAYRRARALKPEGPLALSSRRRRYGLAAARTEQDLQDEAALYDPTAHAYALIGLHPDIAGFAATPAAHVQINYIAQDQNASDLADLLTQYGQSGPAMPAVNPGQPNPGGWATLAAVPAAGGQPARLRQGPDAGRIVYLARWQSDVSQLAGKAMVGLMPQVKDDESLGGDSTPGNLARGGAGLLWLRRDGRPNVASAGAAAADANVKLTLKRPGPQAGLDFKASNANGRSIDLDMENWYLRYLGVYLQFLGEKGEVLKLADLPEYAAGGIVTTGNGAALEPGTLDSDDTLYVVAVPPINTIFGVPVEEEGPFGTGSAGCTLTLPAKATTARFLLGGLGTGSNDYPGTILGGAGLTVLICYGLTAVMAAAGAASSIGLVCEAALNLMTGLITATLAIVNEALTAAGGVFTSAFWINMGETMASWFFGIAVGDGLAKLVAYVVGLIGLAAAEDAIPVADIIMAAVSAATGAADIILTTADIALSPWTYVNDVTGAYDLGVTLLKDGNASTFPAGADTYKVTVMLDDGTPHVQTLAMPKPPQPVPSTLPPVVFPGLPLGGQVNISAAFVQSATVAGQDDILLGKASSGLLPNDGTAKTLQITEIAFPVGPNTLYRHQQKTELDGSGQHVWVGTPIAPATTGEGTCGGPNTLCGFNSLTVRQGSQGYLGYSWRGQNAAGAAAGCNPSGQLDQAAILNTGADAQAGYATTRCGTVVDGVRVAYSLLAHDDLNFYLDPGNDPGLGALVRQVTLGASPSFDDPANDRAWGALNLSSDLLLLHPAGYVVSLNGANHRIESVKLPPAAVSDAVARSSLLAQVSGGQGSRPGLIDTPAAAAISTDGVVLVLESGNNRIQAFDIGGNPVPYFGKQPRPYFLVLDQTDPNDGWTYLDMATEYTGFIYVLCANLQTGSAQYRLDIYHPGQTGTAPVTGTPGVIAGRVAVDLWRSVYTLNYEVIPSTGGAGPGGTPPLTEPSVSLWAPCNRGQTCA